ncbi:MAG TPA: 50S ribosomal protein L18 [Candidatus Saccharibacteria bacterium]|nr:50S ribosomal protein L18 [Candidatus Saccharibacteria bacterium]
MNRLFDKKTNLQRRKIRIRKRVSGTAVRPRMSVSISNKNITVQLIDDEKHNTLVDLNTFKIKDKNMSEKAIQAGTEIAKKAKAKKITTVVFDRNGKLYHGRIKALADAARKEGLEF